MIVAVSIVRVVQVTGDQVVDVVTVRKRLVTAALPVMVPSSVAAACVVGDTSIGIGATDSDAMIVHVASVDVVKVSVVEIVGVSFVAEHGVPAARPVNVTTVTLMLGTAHVFALRCSYATTGVRRRRSLPRRRNLIKGRSLEPHGEDAGRGRTSF